MVRALSRSPVRTGLRALQALVAAGLLVLTLGLLAGSAPSLVGYESFVVLSGSMEPALGVGDLAVVGPRRPDELRVGDVISYRTAARPDLVVTHRLVGITREESGRLIFETRGDANDSADQVVVEGGAVLGRVVYAVPKVGYVVDFARRPLGKVLLFGVPGLLLLMDGLRGRRKPRWGRTSPADALVCRAWVAQRNGDARTALGLLDQAIAKDPRFEEAWLLKAECLDDLSERVACLRAGLLINPDSIRLQVAADDAMRLGVAAEEAARAMAAADDLTHDMANDAIRLERAG